MTSTHRDELAPAQDLESLKILWKALGDTPTDADGCLEEAFQHFPEGTKREEVWHWFEAQNPAFCAAFGGPRPWARTTAHDQEDMVMSFSQVTLSQVELDTVLAALRLFQATPMSQVPEAVMAIATDHSASALHVEEIDELCDRLNAPE